MICTSRFPCTPSRGTRSAKSCSAISRRGCSSWWTRFRVQLRCCARARSHARCTKPWHARLSREHLRRDERHALGRDVKAPAILLGIHAGSEPRRKPAVLVDDRALENDAAADIRVRQDYGVLDAAVAVDVNVAEEERALQLRAADDATARDDGIERVAAAV